MKKRILSLLLTICMALLLVPTVAFAETDILLGDLNGDGVISARDLLQMRHYLIGLTEFTDEQIALGDVNCDGNTNILDCTMLYKYILELIDELGSEEDVEQQTNIPPKPIISCAGTDDSIKVNATSNYFPTASTIVDEDGEYVTVTYFIDSNDMDLLDLQWTLTYDPAFLEFDESVNKKDGREDSINLMPMLEFNFMWNHTNDENTKKIKAIAQDVDGYAFANKGLVPFVSATFKIIGSGETEVNLYVECLSLVNETVVVNSGAVNEEIIQPDRMAAAYGGLYDSDYQPHCCVDADMNHKCDYDGCAVTFGEHKDDNKDHACDYGCSVTIGKHTGGEATCTSKAICDYCKTEYGELDSTNHNLENIPAKDATVTETGNKEYWHCKDCGKHFSDKDGKNTIELNDTVTQKLPPKIIEGKGQSITEGEKKALSFTSNAAFGDFIRVELDGKTLDKKNYTVKEGSTVVTLKADYAATLSVGEHTIGIVSESGTATTAFTVNVKMNAWDKTVLRPQASASKTSIKMKWNAVPEADGYVIYWNQCGAKSAFKQIKVIKSGKTLTWTHKGLKKGSLNKYYVKAYKMIGNKKQFIKTSKQIHLAAEGGKYTNVKKLNSGVSSVTLKKGKTKALKVTSIYAERNKKPVTHMRTIAYTTSNKKVAAVTSKGVIKAAGKGSCYIYITASSGVYTRVKVVVK
ncbi:MAG: dockerin type I domain-containing protein [Lachnospiraceae bacterium]